MYGRIYNRDETQLKVGSELIWLWWVAIEPTKDKKILSLIISKERGVFIAVEQFKSHIVKYYDLQFISTNCGTWNLQMWKFLKVDH